MLKLVSVYDDIWKPNEAEGSLYFLLKERTDTVNISHKVMPTFQEHCAFVLTCPYLAWYLGVLEQGSKRSVVGSTYLTFEDEIGVFVYLAWQHQGYGREMVNSLMQLHGPREYVANINPRNARSIRLFEFLGFKAIQTTYRLDT